MTMMMMMMMIIIIIGYGPNISTILATLSSYVKVTFKISFFIATTI